jgi:hypothetical protein
LQLQSTDRNDPVFRIPFCQIRLSGGRIPFSEFDCPGRFRRQIKTRNCHVRQTNAQTVGRFHVLIHRQNCCLRRTDERTDYMN